MRGEIRQRDLAIAPLGHRHAVGKKFGHRIGQGDLTAARHVREQKRREFLGDGTNLEDRLAIQPPVVVLREAAERENPATIRVDHADDEANAKVLPVHSLREDLPNLGVRWT